ncbi:MAG TPA: nuclear transport factor 2 family protein [Acidimicrobiales bacterium]
MEAAAEISGLIFRYAECIDGGDFGGVADLLAEAELTAGDGQLRCRGRAAVLRQYERSTRRYEDGTPHTKHVTTNVVIDVDEAAGTAAARSYYTVFQQVTGVLSLQPIIAGRYHDRFERTPAGWRFTSRDILVDLVGDLRHHLLFDLPAG